MSIAPYMAIGLVPLVRGVHARSEIAVNLDHLEELFGFGCQMSGLDLPVKLVAIPEGALQGFSDEAEDLDHVEYAAAVAIDIPGPETARIAADRLHHHLADAVADRGADSAPVHGGHRRPA